MAMKARGQVAYQYTTTAVATNRQSPLSMSRGMSKIHIRSPRHQHRMTSQSIARRTAGCTIPFSTLRWRSSEKTIEPSFWRSSEPSGRRISCPKWLTIFCKAGVPGNTTLRASTSASIIEILWARRRVDTVDFPVAIPPVKPTTEGLIHDSYFKGC